jgi:hypothetical protein
MSKKRDTSKALFALGKRPWTEEEKSIVLDLKKAKLPNFEIAICLNMKFHGGSKIRSDKSVKYLLREIKNGKENATSDSKNRME